MFTWLTSLWGERKSNPVREIKIGNNRYDLASAQVLNDYFQRLPGFVDGFPAIPVQQMLDKNQDVIDQILLARGLSGYHNGQEAELKIRQPIRRLAAMTHVLPASEKDFFNYPTGLFRFCLESALSSIHFAERRVLTRSTPEIRMHEEALWGHATFLNGLYSEAINVLARVSIYAGKEHRGLEWHPATELLEEWLNRNGISRYFVRWSPQPDRSKIHLLASKAIDIDQVKLLAEGEWRIFNTLNGSLHDVKDISNPLAKISEQIRYKIIERDYWSRPESYGKPLSGMHLEPWLIDAMRYLVKMRRWEANSGNGRLWIGQDGVFLVWPLAFHDLQIQLREAECPFVPLTDDVMADILVQAGIIAPVNNGSYETEIAVPLADCADYKTLTAVRVLHSEALFGKAEPPQALPIDLRVHSEPATVPPLDDNGRVAESTVNLTVDAEPYAVPNSFDGNETAQDREEFISEAIPVEMTPLRADQAIALVSSPPDQLQGEDPANWQPTADLDLLEQLLGSQTPPETRTRAMSSIPLEATDSTFTQAREQGRIPLLLAKLAALPEQYRDTLPGGMTRIRCIGLKDHGLNLQDIVQALKSANLIEPVMGLDTGLLEPGEPKTQYFIVRRHLQ